MQHKTPRVRSCMKRDRDYLRRARLRYIKFRRAWLEEDHERVFWMVERMWELQLFAKGSGAEGPCRCSIIRHIAQWCDHVRMNDHDEFNRWLVKSGWSGQYGWWNSKRARARASRQQVA